MTTVCLLRHCLPFSLAGQRMASSLACPALEHGVDAPAVMAVDEERRAGFADHLDVRGVADQALHLGLRQTCQHAQHFKIRASLRTRSTRPRSSEHAGHLIPLCITHLPTRVPVNPLPSGGFTEGSVVR